MRHDSSPKIKTRTWVILFLVLFFALCGGSYALYHMDTGGTVANVYQDGVCIRSFDLSAATGTLTCTITDTDGHENTILVGNGRICISCANCPDQVCVQTGWISQGLQPIVCLPARLVIQIESDAQTNQLAIDGVVE